MKVSRTITVDKVTRCRDCPWHNPHPYEASCGLKRKLDKIYSEYKGYGDIVGHWEVDKNCPIKLGRYPRKKKFPYKGVVN